MIEQDLPTFGHCVAKLARGIELTALERLIHDNEPAVGDEKFREQVAATISDEVHRIRNDNLFFMACLLTQLGGELELKRESMVRAPVGAIIETRDDPISGSRFFRLRQGGMA